MEPVKYFCHSIIYLGDRLLFVPKSHLPWKCMICGKKFKSEAGFRKHEKEKHKTDDS